MVKQNSVTSFHDRALLLPLPIKVALGIHFLLEDMRDAISKVEEACYTLASLFVLINTD